VASSCGWRHRRHPRAYVDPPSVKVRHQGRKVIALGVSMAKGGDIIAWASAAGGGAAVQAELPVGIELEQVQDQPRRVAVGGRVRARAGRGGGHRAGGQLHQPGPALRPLRLDIWPGLVVGITIPLVLAITFVTMYYWGVGLHKISLGS
jgi:multidrug efflux pump